MTTYEKRIKTRSNLRYYIGLVVRLRKHIIYSLIRFIARCKGARIGEGVVMPLSLAIHANSNLKVGSHTSIQTNLLDLRSPITIGEHVIIGHGTEILTVSHNIDSPEWEAKCYGITIADYAWIPTKALILPSCQSIGRGAVVGSGSVVAKNVPEMAIVSGNPATLLRERKCIHDQLVVEELLGGDFNIYRRVRKERKQTKC